MDAERTKLLFEKAFHFERNAPTAHTSWRNPRLLGRQTMALNIDALHEYVQEGGADYAAVHGKAYSPLPPLPDSNRWKGKLPEFRSCLDLFKGRDPFKACKHAFEHLGGRLIYVELADNRVRRFVPFANPDWHNDWPHIPEEVVADYVTRRSLMLGRREAVCNYQEWWSTGHLLCNVRSPEVMSDKACAPLLDMFDTVCKSRRVPNASFLINVRDCAAWRKDGQRPCPLPWRPFGTARAEAVEGALPTFSFYTGPGFWDVPCPTATDWLFATQNRSLGRDPLPPPPLDVPFRQKHARAIWRGSLTGPGSEPESNDRVKLLMQPPSQFLDVAATGANADRDRVDAVSGRLTGSASHYVPSQRSNYVPWDKQALNRYAIVLDGHGAPDRFHPALASNQVVLRPHWTRSLVMSPCTLMDCVAQPNEHYVPLYDVSDAEQVVERLEQDVPRAEKIAQAARDLWQERLSVDGILDFWQMALHALPVTAREARIPPKPAVRLRNIRLLRR